MSARVAVITGASSGIQTLAAELGNGAIAIEASSASWAARTSSSTTPA
jgi:hypothetical protein